MHDGKKTVAQRILYDAFDLMEARTHQNSLDTFERALRNATPVLEVKPRRVGGSTYQVPVEIRGDRRRALATRWLIQSARKRAGKSMAEKLAAELLDASNGVGATIKKREDTHRMAEANRAFAHYRF
jgi:small subunit ribosomal protein S7